MDGRDIVVLCILAKSKESEEKQTLKTVRYVERCVRSVSM